MSTPGISQPPAIQKPRAYVLPPGLKINLLLAFFNRFRGGDPIRVFRHLFNTYGDAAHYKLGNLLNDCGQLQPALESYDRVVALDQHRCLAA